MMHADDEGELLLVDEDIDEQQQHQPLHSPEEEERVPLNKNGVPDAGSASPSKHHQSRTSSKLQQHRAIDHQSKKKGFKRRSGGGNSSGRTPPSSSRGSSPSSSSSYKQRKRVYERLRARLRGEPEETVYSTLETVHEDEEGSSNSGGRESTGRQRRSNCDCCHYYIVWLITGGIPQTALSSSSSSSSATTGISRPRVSRWFRFMRQMTMLMVVCLIAVAGVQETVQRIQQHQDDSTSRATSTWFSGGNKGNRGDDDTLSGLRRGSRSIGGGSRSSSHRAPRRHRIGDNEIPTSMLWRAFADDDIYDNELLLLEADSSSSSSGGLPTIPDALRYMADVREPLLPEQDRAFFWQIPRSGGGTVQQIVTQCFGLLAASESGASSVGSFLSTVTNVETGGQFVNIDTSTLEGLQHAGQLRARNIPDLRLVASSYLYEASEQLFSEYYRGRIFTLMRHPIERAASLFYAMNDDPQNKAVVGMTLVDYAKSNMVERNWMVRFLSHNMVDELTTDDLRLAKYILQTKVLIGLLHDKSESMKRFEQYFGWHRLNHSSERAMECHAELLEWNWPNKHKHPMVREGSEAWNLLAKVNDMDMELYRFAVRVFEQQGKRLFFTPSSKSPSSSGRAVSSTSSRTRSSSQLSNNLRS